MAPPPSLAARAVCLSACLAVGVWLCRPVIGDSAGSLWQAAASVRPAASLGVHPVARPAQPPSIPLPAMPRNALEAHQPFQAGGGPAGQKFPLDNSNVLVGATAATGAMLGAVMVAVYRRVTRSSDPEGWSIAAVASADPEAKPKAAAAEQEAEPLPPHAGTEAFRPDLFQYDGPRGTTLLTDIPYVKTRKYFTNRTFNGKDILFFSILTLMHTVAFVFGPLTYRPDCLALAAGLYAITGLGITFSYHRQLSHKAFTTPKWLEYMMAYCGVQALEGSPQEWVTTHRYHHMYQETDRDPHTINEGFWWSHMGWLLDNEATHARVEDRSISVDITSDPFYQFIEKTYPIHPIMMACALYAWGGFPYLVWGMAVRIVWTWHITWLVNGASHSWGNKRYKTSPPDESRNNWWVGLLALGEGWHNNHHAFQYSARLGLEWWQVDVTWYLISFLKALGLAKNVKLPTEARKKAMLLTN